MEKYVVAYGGSIIIPNETYDEKALNRLVSIVEENNEKQFIFVIGGGRLARNTINASLSYLEQALQKNPQQIDSAKDEFGIASTKVNAEYTRSYLEDKLGSDVVYEEIVHNPSLKVHTNKRVIVASGWRPGITTDYDMMLFAKTYGASAAYKISNFPIVLNVNPFEFEKEKIDSYEQLPKLTWKQMLDLVGTKFKPGGNYPLDPPSAVLGNEIIKTTPDFTLYIGQKEQVEKMLCGEDFIGTIVSNK